MEGIVRAVTEHPLVAIAVCFAVLLILYLLLKSLFKSLINLALILTIAAAAVGGYFYFQYPEPRPANFNDAEQKARNAAVKAVDWGKEVYREGRELLDKGNETYRKGKEWIDKGETVLDTGAYGYIAEILWYRRVSRWHTGETHCALPVHIYVSI